MQIVTIPLNSDNYGYIIVDDKSKECAVVDVSGQPQVILEEVAKLDGIKFTTIFSTHKHWDHAGGNAIVREAVPEITVYGGKLEGVEACTNFVEDGQELIFGDRIRVRCLLTPGHTTGHISFYMEDDSTDQRAVFTGDCLFVGGVGKFFEGTGADMYPSLYEKLGKLPPDTLIYCGHEYTLSNYKFAVSIDPTNKRLLDEVARAQQLRSEGKFTIPSTIEQELATNPFLRIYEPSIRKNFPGVEDPFELLTAVREAKNKF
mmetsp:Transcript_28619/g.48045  ORF Transcript_28619/g.48045 Transcript_28619/m.48045 type:complete len:260 (-) Transcript_28619:438-1217(-)